VTYQVTYTDKFETEVDSRILVINQNTPVGELEDPDGRFEVTGVFW